MAVSLPKEHKVRFYASPDLKAWTHLSDFGPAGDVAGDWECPDLLHVPEAAGKGSGMWALKVGLNPGALQGGSGEQYFLGDFDGKSFTLAPAARTQGWTNYGKDDYCAISFNDLPRAEKPLLLGWMSNWQYAAKLPTSPWRGQMSLPRRLSLVHDTAGAALKQEPVIEPLRRAGTPVRITATSAPRLADLGLQEPPYEIDLHFPKGAETVFGLRIYADPTHFTEIAFDRTRHEFSIDRTRAGQTIAPDFPARTVAPLLADRPDDLKLIVDRSSVEAFVQGGTIAMTNLLYPLEKTQTVKIFTASGKPVPVQGTLWKLDSIWK